MRWAFARKLKRDLSNFPDNFSKESKINPMTSKLLRVLLGTASVLPILALAQASSAPAALPAAPSAAASSAAAPAVTNPTGTKLGTINIEQAIFATNEGQRDFETLSKKLEPKQNELKGMNDEVENLKKQLNTQGDKLADDARGTLVKQIEDKQKKLERSVQDARDDAQNQQNEIAQRILQKMAPMLVKYAGDNGFGVIMDTSNPWPNGPVLWAGPSVDITKPVVDAYNAQSGVPAPAPGSTRSPGTKPSGSAATKPVAPATKPQGSSAPPK
jgi:outer membrane protein